MFHSDPHLMSMKIAVLLTCHNRKTKTLTCLTALFSAKIPEGVHLDVFLVDDGSTDGTSEAVKTTFQSVTVIQGNGNLFWNRGMHLAWKTAAETDRFDYFLWLNDDTMLYPIALQELLSCAKGMQNKAVVCSSICSEITGEFTYGGRSEDGKEIVPNGSIQKCHHINGNCVLVSNEIYSKVGQLDPIFPHAIGDFEYGLRVLKHGFDLVVTTRYVGTCEKNPTMPKWCYSHVPLRQRLKVLYSPLGNSHPYYFFIYEKRHYGLGRALFHFATIHLRAFSPSLWNKIKGQ